MIWLEKTNILGRKKTRLELWEEHLKDPIIAMNKALNEVCGESVSRLIVCLRLLRNLAFNDLRPSGFRYGARVVGQTFVEKCLALFRPVG